MRTLIARVLISKELLLYKLQFVHVRKSSQHLYSAFYQQLF